VSTNKLFREVINDVKKCQQQQKDRNTQLTNRMQCGLLGLTYLRLTFEKYIKQTSSLKLLILPEIQTQNKVLHSKKYLIN
jgi:hypothetical protein